MSTTYQDQYMPVTEVVITYDPVTLNWTCVASGKDGKPFVHIVGRSYRAVRLTLEEALAEFWHKSIAHYDNVHAM
jgi:hypothetical protein